MIGIDPNFPNMHSMEMAGFRYAEDGRTQLPRVERKLLCSECNTGTWHGEFDKTLATEAEVLMGEQLKGDDHNIFTSHPMWKLYDKDPDSFDIELLKKISLEPTEEDRIGRIVRNSLEELTSDMSWMHGSHDPYIRDEPKVGRNDQCPCGSGKKYKKCCGGKRNVKRI